MKREFDIIIVGAGPAGTAACLALADSGLSIALIDKSSFPRDKICGDALSPDVVNQLRKLPYASHESFEHLSEKIETRAIRFVAPNYSVSDFPLPDESLQGYVIPRMDFDSFMYEQGLKNPHVTDLTGTPIRSMNKSEDGVTITLANEDVIHAPLVFGADGANSMVKRLFQNEPIDRFNHAVAVRQYFSNVTGFSDDNAIELHFYDEVLPGSLAGAIAWRGDGSARPPPRRAAARGGDAGDRLPDPSAVHSRLRPDQAQGHRRGARARPVRVDGDA